MSVLALLALIAVPVLYGGLYLWANQDPYAQVPRGAGRPRRRRRGHAPHRRRRARGTIGDEVADELIADGAFDWHRVSADEAARRTRRLAATTSRSRSPPTSPTALASVQTDDPAPGRDRARDERREQLPRRHDRHSRPSRRSAPTIAEQVGRGGRPRAARLDLDDPRQARRGGRRRRPARRRRRSERRRRDPPSSRAGSGPARRRRTPRLADGHAPSSPTGSRASSRRRPAGRRRATRSSRHPPTASGAAVGDGDRRTARRRAPTSPPRLAARGRRPGARSTTVLARLDPLGDELEARQRHACRRSSGRSTSSPPAAARSPTAQRRARRGAQTAADGAAAAAAARRAARGRAARRRRRARATASPTLARRRRTLRDGLADGVAADPRLRPGDPRRPGADDRRPDRPRDDRGRPRPADYGAGLAPFFAALAGWIGIYALFLIVKPVSRRAVTALHSPIRVTLAGWLTPGAPRRACRWSALFARARGHARLLDRATRSARSASWCSRRSRTRRSSSRSTCGSARSASSSGSCSWCCSS